jgi:diacylglycerol kinase family enzyme
MAFLSALRFLGRPMPRYAVELVADGQPEQRLTTTLFFGCNARQLEDFQIAAAACLRHQQLAVLSLTLRSRWELLLAACAAVRGRLDTVATLDTCCARTVRVQTRHRRVKVAIDGELARLRPPLAVQLRLGALQVFAPRVEHSGTG